MRLFLQLLAYALYLPTCVAWMTTPKDSYFTRFYSEMVVPAEQPHQGTLFLWPGLQSLGSSYNFEPIDNGVLQPVLTWGSSCAPGHQPKQYSSWWISGQYVNTFGHHAGYTGCLGGDIMSVKPGDKLHMDMYLSKSNSTQGIWHQLVNNNSTGRSVSYHIDMLGQGQNWAELVYEFYSPPALSFTVHFQNIYSIIAHDFGKYCTGTPYAKRLLLHEICKGWFEMQC